ncbi:VWA domain-containing protein [Nocardia sp. NBC_00565]|uniref:VWA domain-containing protein n=1 Tax=Nocardia sp. NBC_00565 TaxID=2975993 RepID=UPI002E80EE62|nr:VWA domain-containing protein [Nocardia sp. NBC_00565]WUC03729.1 VWA domain-containing protein [Nocardia sp. NBC_00565]
MGIFSRDRMRSTADLARDCAARPITLVKGSGPAVNRATVEQRGGVDLTKKFDKAGISLSKAGLDGIRAEAVMILDHSGSMCSGYQNGMVQTLVDRALAFALQIDGDGKIPVIPFDSRLWPTVEVALDNYANVVNREIFRPSQMGGTLLAPALRQVLDMAKTAVAPLYVVIVTDDDPHDRAEVVQLLKELKRYAVFVKVLTLVNAPFWDSMDDLDVPGLIDNLDAKRVINPASMSDLAFADVMVDEWQSWVTAATSAGILAS